VVLKVGGSDASRQFKMLHDASVLLEHASLCIGEVDEAATDNVVAAPTLDSEWMFGTWKPPVGRDRVRLPLLSWSSLCDVHLSVVGTHPRFPNPHRCRSAHPLQRVVAPPICSQRSG
jgi:hypothetical protein